MNKLKTIVIAFAVIIVSFSCSEKKKETVEKEKTFQFVPKSPVNGKYSGIVEMGGDGFNSFIINSDSSGYWFIEQEEYGVSNAYDNKANTEEIKSGLEAYIEKMIGYNVDGKNIHFIVSSTARENERVSLISTILDSIGYVVNSVDESEEARYALIAALPPEFSNKGFVVDVGSGNTKISWKVQDSIYTSATYGSKYYTNNVTDEMVYNDVISKLKQVPAKYKKHCFIIGGIPYKLAKAHRKEEERYTVLKKPETYKTGEDKKFDAGLNIYKAISEDRDTDLVLFDWEANFSIGFLLEVGKK